jgi:hypothetical protein
VSATATATLAATTVAAATQAPGDATTTGKIVIPSDVIESAPIQVTGPEDASLVSIPGQDNSTLVDARPDLQAYVETAGQNASTNTTAKRDVVST